MFALDKVGRVVELGALGGKHRSCMITTTDSEAKRPRSFRLLLAILVAVLIYVLSVRPAVRFYATRSIPSGMRPGGVVGRIWQPVLALDDTKARPVYRAYMSLWGVTYYQPIDAVIF